MSGTIGSLDQLSLPALFYYFLLYANWLSLWQLSIFLLSDIFMMIVNFNNLSD